MGAFEVVGPILLALVVIAGLLWFGRRIWWTGNGGPTVSRAASSGSTPEATSPGKGARSRGKKVGITLAALVVIAVAVLRPGGSAASRRP